MSLLGFQYPLNLLQSKRICLLVSIGYSLHEHENSKLGKNQSLYSPMGAWLVIALVARAHSKLEWPTICSHGHPLIYDSSTTLRSSLSSSRKFLPFPLEAWNVIFQSLISSSLLDFLQNSQEILFGKEGITTKDLESLSTSWWSFHLSLLGHSQNSIELESLAMKKFQRLLRIAAE